MTNAQLRSCRSTLEFADPSDHTVPRTEGKNPVGASASSRQVGDYRREPARLSYACRDFPPRPCAYAPSIRGNASRGDHKGVRASSARSGVVRSTHPAESAVETRVRYRRCCASDGVRNVVLAIGWMADRIFANPAPCAFETNKLRDEPVVARQRDGAAVQSW